MLCSLKGAAIVRTLHGDSYGRRVAEDAVIKAMRIAGQRVNAAIWPQCHLSDLSVPYPLFHLRAGCCELPSNRHQSPTRQISTKQPSDKVSVRICGG